MKLAFFHLIGFLILLTSSCNFNIKRGNGNIENVTTNIEKFENLSIGGNYNVVLIKGEKPKVVIETDENLHEYINIEVFNGTLNINNIHNLKSTDGIYISVYYNELNNIYSTGTSSIINEGILSSDQLSINFSGAGTVNLKLDVIEIKSILSGAGVVSLSGKANNLETHISGAGGLRAFELASENADINVSGLGGVEVFARNELIITITGLGGVLYSGNPKVVEKRITGLGKIKQVEE